ncbi:hypothetical protein ACN4EE_11970 [Geminocystis sp. CENA526]
MPIFITDSRRVIEKTGWKRQRDAKMTLIYIYEWIRDNEVIVKGIFV